MAGFALKVKSKSGQQIVNLKSQCTIAELKSLLSSLTDIKASRLNILFGYPPKPLDLTVESKDLSELGIASGDTIIVEERAENPSPSGAGTQAIETQPQGILIKRVVPSDNSCLFTSIGFVLNGKVDTTVGPYLRHIIAEVVSSDPATYSDAFLGKPNHEYCEWIQKSNSWGGAIEVSVLSRVYGIEMDVVDTLNAIINRFGEDQDYGQRVFLLFDGIHYDPLYMEHEQGNVQTLFPIEDMEVYNAAEQLAKEMKSARKITYSL